MKKYFAVCYFASPEIGMVTAGEVLSEEQVKKLGEATVESLVMRGALGEIVEKTAEEKPEKAETKAEEPKEPETGTEAEPEKAETKEPETGTEAAPEEEEAEELPELEISADLVGEPEKAPKSSAKKTGGRRK